jgi:hypothetical protein
VSHTRFGFQARNTPAERRAFFDLIRNDHKSGRDAEVMLDAIETLGNEVVGEIQTPNPLSTASTSYVDIPTTPLSVSLTKRSAASLVLIEVHVSAFGTGAGEMALIGVNCPTVGDQQMGKMWFNTLGQHMSWSFKRTVSGVAAGAGTYTLRARSNTGALTLNIDGNDYVSLHVREMI